MGHWRDDVRYFWACILRTPTLLNACRGNLLTKLRVTPVFPVMESRILIDNSPDLWYSFTGVSN